MARVLVTVAVALGLLVGCSGQAERRTWWKELESEEPSALAFTDVKLAHYSLVGAGKATGGYTGEGQAGKAPIVAGEKGLTLESHYAFPTGVEIEAIVRLVNPPTGHATATLAVGRHEAPDPANPAKQLPHQLMLSVVNARGTDNFRIQALRDGKTLHDLKALTEKLDWQALNENDFSYSPRAYTRYLPGWTEDFRARVEHGMAELPAWDEKWFRLRIELDKGFARLWFDDHLVAWKRDDAMNTEGKIAITLTPGAQLASWKVTPRVATPGFLPIQLAGYANAKVFLPPGKNVSLLGDSQPQEKIADSGSVDPASLPRAGQTAMVHGVPFVFPGKNAEGNDHLDIGRSFLRQANSAGYISSMYGTLPRWRGSTERDPARIQLRVPVAQYDALYIVAASDEDDDSVPLISAMFFRPGAGFAKTFEAEVPLATAFSGGDAKRLGVQIVNGRKANLWLVKIPLDPAAMTSFGDLDVFEIELTKKVHLYRSYPDPINYGYHQGGPPSAVHVFAATLHEAEVGFTLTPDNFGHVWTAPAVPSYTATLVNRSTKPQAGTLTVTTKGYDGTETNPVSIDVALQPGETRPVKVELPVKLNGYHDVSATLNIGGQKWTEARSLCRLAPDTRTVRWTEGRGAMFGYWSYSGGHHTPKGEHHINLMTLAGARQNQHPHAPFYPMQYKHWGRGQSTAYYVSPQAWAAEETHKPEDIAAFHAAIDKAFVQWEKDTPEQFLPDCVNYFTESHISPRLTAGNFPEYWQDPPFEYTPEEKKRLRMFYETARIAGEYLRKTHPDRKLMIEWGSPLFVIPLLRAGFPKDLIDGSSPDMPLFERLPEMQLADNVLHQLYELKEEYKKYGMPNPRLQYCEGSFVPTEPGAVNYREQMDIYHRWTLLSMAYGVTRFHAGWFAFDCTNYYGSEHYGGCGIQRKIPYADPKPAYAAYATMTQVLNEMNFDGWVPTGSLSTYCLRFKHADGHKYVYALWTIRGKRPVTLSANGASSVEFIDSMNNRRAAHHIIGNKGTSTEHGYVVNTDASVIYVKVDGGAGTITQAIAGAPDNSDALTDAAREGSLSRTGIEEKAQPLVRTEQIQGPQVADLGDGSWRFTDRKEPIYETNHWGFYPAAGKFSSSILADKEKGKVFASKLEDQGRPRELMPWYNILKPEKPITIPGAPSHLGLWVKGDSGWGRFIYILRDAKGERWISIGTKDDYNCDDIHGWSRVNFDGWRYCRFELPGHLGYDSFRRHGTTWWRSGVGAEAAGGGVESEKVMTAKGETGDNIVDLPLQLEEIIVEQRTHILYVNDVQPVKSDTLLFGKLYAEYERPEDAKSQAVATSRLRMPVPTGLPDLPNPIADLQRDGIGAAPGAVTLRAPEHYYDGTRMHVDFKEVEGAKKYNLWVSAHEDGRGALDLVPGGIKPGQLVTGLRPGVKLYYWLTYDDAANKTSKPSPVHGEVTVDNFKEK